MIRPTLASALCLAASAAFAHPAMTGDPTTMVAAPSSQARVVQEIPQHAQIDLGECGERWCAASWRNMDGYVRVEAVAPNDAPLAGPPRPRPPIFIGGPVIFGPAFGYGYYYHRRW